MSPNELNRIINIFIILLFLLLICSKLFLHLKIIFYISFSELLPLLEAGVSWEVSAFASQIYLPSSSDSSYPVFFIFLIFQHQFPLIEVGDFLLSFVKNFFVILYFIF